MAQIDERADPVNHPLICPPAWATKFVVMSDELTKAREELDKEFNQFRENLGKIYEKLERVSQAGPTDDVSELLKDLEDTVGTVRTGGLVGSGAKGHREAREKYMKLQGLKP